MTWMIAAFIAAWVVAWLLATYWIVVLWTNAVFEDHRFRHRR